MGQFNKLYIIIIFFFPYYFKCISINLNVFQWVCHANNAGLMRSLKQAQPPFYYSPESKLFNGDLLQLQLKKHQSRQELSIYI